MLPLMDTFATRGQADPADQCELANDLATQRVWQVGRSGPWKAIAGTVVSGLDVQRRCLVGSDQPRPSGRLAFYATELIVEMTVDISSTRQYLTCLLIA